MAWLSSDAFTDGGSLIAVVFSEYLLLLCCVALVAAVIVLLVVNMFWRVKADKSLLHAVVKDLPAMVCRYRPDGTIVFVNDACCEHFGMSREELIGKNFFHLLPEEDREQVRVDLLSLVADQPVMVHEHEVHAEDGSLRYQRWVNRAVYDEQGKVALLQAYGEDITERKTTEKFLQDAVNAAHVGLWDWDLATDIVCFSAEWKRMIGYEEDEIGDDIHEWKSRVHPEDLEPTLDHVNICLAEARQDYSVEFRFRHKDGSYRWILSSGSTVVDPSGRPIRLRGSHIDITERKQAESAMKQRLIALTQPLADVGSIRFEDLFNLTEIQQLQDRFSSATRVASIITRPDGAPITAPSNFCRLCRDIIRKSEKGCANCLKSDAALGKLCIQGPTLQPCMSGGLWDAGAGIEVGGHHIANWLIGQVRDETQTEESMRQYAREIEVDEEEMIRAFREVPMMSREQFENVAAALFSLARQLSTLAYQNVQQARFITERTETEEALRQGEERLRSIFRAAPIGIGVVSSRVFKEVNEQLCDMTGYPAEELLEKNARMLYLSDEDYEYVGQEKYRQIAEQGTGTVEARWRCKDGRVIDVLLSSTPIDITDLTVGVTFTALDITERNLTEASLRQEKAFSDTVIDSLPGIFYLFDQQGHFLRWNRNFEEVTGYSPEEISRMNPLDFFMDEDQPFIAEQIQQVFEKGYASPEANFITKSRRPIPYFFIGHRFIMNGKSYLVGTGHDIAARKQAEEQLQQYREHLEELVEDRTRELAAAKESAEEALAELRSTQGQLVQSEKLAVLGRVAAGVAHEVNSPLGAIGASSESIDYSCQCFVDHLDDLLEWAGESSTGEVKDLLGKVFQSKHLVMSTRERRKMRDQLEQVFTQRDVENPRELADFFIDLNLQEGVNRYLQAFQSDGSGARMDLLRSFSNVGRSISIIQTAAQGASRIIKALQAYSQQKPSGEETSLVDVRHEIENVLTLHHNRYKATVEVIRYFDEVPLLECYREELAQVWSNLIINALQAMEYQGRLTITIHPRDDQIRVAIRDTGCGIAEELQANVFQPFFTTKAPGEGCGLGLDIVHGIVQRHHGRIWFESTPGKGTKFTVQLPSRQPVQQ